MRGPLLLARAGRINGDADAPDPYKRNCFSNCPPDVFVMLIGRDSAEARLTSL